VLCCKVRRARRRLTQIARLCGHPILVSDRRLVGHGAVFQLIRCVELVLLLHGADQLRPQFARFSDRQGGGGPQVERACVPPHHRTAVPNVDEPHITALARRGDTRRGAALLLGAVVCVLKHGHGVDADSNGVHDRHHDGAVPGCSIAILFGLRHQAAAVFARINTHLRRHANATSNPAAATHPRTTEATLTSLQPPTPSATPIPYVETNLRSNRENHVR